MVLRGIMEEDLYRIEQWIYNKPRYGKDVFCNLDLLIDNLTKFKNKFYFWNFIIRDKDWNIIKEI
jgi:hypothetical protein